MSKQIKLTEEQLKKVVYNTTKRIINEMHANDSHSDEEELDEWFGRNVADKFGAMKDTFKNGGSYSAHLANRNLQRSRNDIENLKGKYGVSDGQNKSQYVNNASNRQIEQIRQKYDEKRRVIDQQEQAEIEKVNSKAGKKWDAYSAKKKDLTAQKNNDYENRRKAINADPYANFK